MVAWFRVALACAAVVVPIDVSGLHVSRDAAEAVDSCRPRETCCKVCSTGKACGNTCIRRTYECHVGRGCACDADEICE